MEGGREGRPCAVRCLSSASRRSTSFCRSTIDANEVSSSFGAVAFGMKKSIIVFIVISLSFTLLLVTRFSREFNICNTNSLHSCDNKIEDDDVNVTNIKLKIAIMLL